MKKRVLIAMSGGVDSSVVAFLLKQQGYECIGCTMKLYNNEDIGIKSKTCCSLKDVQDARSVANRLDIKYYVLNFTSDFKKYVIEKLFLEKAGVWLHKGSTFGIGGEGYMRLNIACPQKVLKKAITKIKDIL